MLWNLNVFQDSKQETYYIKIPKNALQQVSFVSKINKFQGSKLNSGQTQLCFGWNSSPKLVRIWPEFIVPLDW